MADLLLVALLLAFVWAAVLVPPAAGARAAREAEFLGSIRPGGHPHDPSSRSADLDAVDHPRIRPGMTANARRRQVLGGLVVAIGVTLLVGLLPTFRLVLVVHLLLVNSCLAYVGLLVHIRDQQAVLTRAAPAGWRDTEPRRSDLRFAEPVHPYAYASAGPDELGYLGGGSGWGEPELGPTGSDADGSGYEGAFEAAWGAETGAGYEGDSYEGDSYEADGYEGDDDADAEAAYVDEALSLRRPA